MTVRRKKVSPRPSTPPPSAELQKAEAELVSAFAPSKGNVQLWEEIRKHQLSKSDEEIAILLADKYAISHTAMKSACRRVRARVVALGSEFAKNGRIPQIVELRARAAEASMMIHNERVREQQAEKLGKKYVRRRNTPTEGDVRAYHELIAKVEGNFAPTKHTVISANLSQEVLDILGVQSPEEIAEYIAEGHRLIETTGESADG